MKVIALMPVRNDAHFLPVSLSCLEQFCDHIFIVVDNQTTDDSVAVAQSFAKVKVIHNTGHSGTEWRNGAMVKARCLLFDAFRSFEGQNIGICTDADEITPPRVFARLREVVAAADRPGSIFSLWWVQLWKSLSFYRDDQSVWSNSWKPMAFHDDRNLYYPEDQSPFHESRTPLPPGAWEPRSLTDFPVLHLQWAYWNRTQYKQAWCRVDEFIFHEFKNAPGINGRYAITLDDPNERLTPVRSEWVEGLPPLPSPDAPLPNWPREQIFRFFGEYGIERFEPLQIWHIDELHDRFVEEIGRAPVPDIGQSPKRSFTYRAARRLVPRPVRAVVRQLLQ